MTTTVIVCTFNRSVSLRAALESVAASVVSPSITWEVLIVDNNSSDETKAVAEEFCRRYPGRFRYVFEPQPGKSYALNTGIGESRGEILAFLDDDVTVSPSWVQGLTKAVQEGNWAGAGGRTLLAHSFTPPPWLALSGPYGMGGILAALFDLGDQPAELTEAPYGTNAAYRRAAFEKYGGFRTDLGPSPNSRTPRPNEDTEFGRRLMAAGERLRYEPSAVVYHPVPTARLEKKYFLDWWFDLGRAGIREIGRRPDIGGIPRPYLTLLKAALVLWPARTMRWLCSWEAKKRFYGKAWVWKTAGEIAETYRCWISRSAPLDPQCPPSLREPTREAARHEIQHP